MVSLPVRLRDAELHEAATLKFATPYCITPPFDHVQPITPITLDARYAEPSDSSARRVTHRTLARPRVAICPLIVRGVCRKRAHELHTKPEFRVSEFCRHRRRMAYHISYGGRWSSSALLKEPKTCMEARACGSTMKERSAQVPVRGRARRREHESTSMEARAWKNEHVKARGSMSSAPWAL